MMTFMGIGRGRAGDCGPRWIFIRDIDKVQGGLMVLFFGLVFFVALPGNFSTDALDDFNHIVIILILENHLNFIAFNKQ